MPVNFSNFKEGTSIVNTDYLIGFNNTSKDGERRWTFEKIKNNVIPDQTGNSGKSLTTNGSTYTWEKLQTPLAYGTFNVRGVPSISSTNSYNILAVNDTSTRTKTVVFSQSLYTDKYNVLFGLVCEANETGSDSGNPRVEESQTISQFVVNHYNESTSANYTKITFAVFG